MLLRSKWIMQFQTVSLQLSVERDLERGERASLCSLRLTELFFPFFVNILFKIILYAVLLHCFAHTLHLHGLSLPLTTWLFFLMSFFACNIASFSKWQICIGFFFCPERYKCLFQLFPNWNLLYVCFCPAYRPTSCSSISWEMWWCRGKEEEWANMSWE